MPNPIDREKLYIAAEMIFSGRTIAQVSAAIGVNEKTIDNWKKRPEFTEAVELVREALRRKVIGRGAACKEVRIMAKRKRISAIMTAVRSRAGDPTKGGADWDKSGFFIQREKMLGSGELATLVTEYELDTSVLRELSSLENEIAQELGEFRRPPERPKTETQVSETVTTLLEVVGNAEELQTLKARFLAIQESKRTVSEEA